MKVAESSCEQLPNGLAKDELRMSDREGKVDKLLITERQAAEILSVAPRTLWGWRKAGEIPFLRRGRCVRYVIDDLRDWIAAQKGDEGPRLERGDFDGTGDFKPENN